MAYPSVRDGGPAFDAPGGELLVWIAAFGITVYGLYQLYRAYISKLGRYLELGSLGSRVGRWIEGVSRGREAADEISLCQLDSLAHLSPLANRHNSYR